MPLSSELPGAFNEEGEMLSVISEIAILQGANPSRKLST